jgi:hypothetical protein
LETSSGTLNPVYVTFPGNIQRHYQFWFISTSKFMKQSSVLRTAPARVFALLMALILFSNGMTWAQDVRPDTKSTDFTAEELAKGRSLFMRGHYGI